MRECVRTSAHDWAPGGNTDDDAVAMATVGEVDRYLRARATERLREFLGADETDADDGNHLEGNNP